jgi:cyclohexanecarboxylate-CoA ligase
MTATETSIPPAAAAFAARPRASLQQRLHAEGIWRDGSPATDLQRWRRETPEATAIIAQRAGADPEYLSYEELGRRVDCIAAGLIALGVRARDIVAAQLPNWWELDALLIACFRIGAVVAPLVSTLGAREQELVLRSTGTSVLVTTGAWQGLDPAAAAAAAAPRLPLLRHRIVVGGATRPGELDFADHLLRTDLPAPTETSGDSDAVSIVLFTSGTTGEPKGSAFLINAMHAAATGLSADSPDGTVWFTPHAHSHVMGLMAGIFPALLTGGCDVLLDVWDPELAVRLMREAGVTHLTAAAPFLEGATGELRSTGGRLPALLDVITGGTVVPRDVVGSVSEVLGLRLRAMWGMTEAGMTITSRDDPADWAWRSAGRPLAGVELQLRGEEPFTDTRPGRLYVRGAITALATFGRDSGVVQVLAEEDDGWYDTGDLAADDGRGGIRVVGRAVDRIGSTFMVPVADVEDTLRTHHAVADVALIGVTDSAGEERIRAVVVPAGEAPTLTELNSYLRGLGMTEWYLPDEISFAASLPRNATGKVQKALLRQQAVSDLL